MKKLAVWEGNGKIYIAADEDLEVAFSDREGNYIVIVPANPDRLRDAFDEARSGIWNYKTEQQ